MLTKRIIPCLDVRQGRVTKGVKFKNNIDLGDTVEMALVSFGMLEKRGMTFAQSLWGLLPVVLYGPLYLYKIRFAPEGKRWEDFYGFNRTGRWPVSFAAMLAGTFLICMGLMMWQNA